MRKILQLVVASLLILSVDIFPQSPVVQQIIDSVNIDSLIYFVRELTGDVPIIINGTTQTILSRHKDQAGNALAETYIKQKLEYYGLPVTIQNFSTSGNNVLGTQVGTLYPDKKFIICAHYDDMPTGTIAPGADDNASGTSAVIEAARILSQHTFPFTIVYALWDEEEQSKVGSKYYVAQAAAESDTILGVIDLDMIAYDSNSDFVCYVHDRNVGSSIQLYNNMVEVNSQYGINLNIVERNPGSYLSDHASFWYNGYSAIWLSENIYTDVNPHYHLVNDLLQYFNQPYYLKVAKLASGTLAVLALNLNFDIIHSPIAALITPQAINTSAFIFTGLQIGMGSSGPRIYYRTKEIGGNYGEFIDIIGNSTGGNYTFNMPVLSNGTYVQYYIAAQDENSTIVRTLPMGGGGFNPPGSTPPATFFQFFEANLHVIMSDEADSITSWTPTGGWNTTTEKFVSPPTSFTDSPSGNYPPNTTTALRYNNQIQAMGSSNAFIEFDAQWAIEYNYDYGQVEISTNNGGWWFSLPGQYTVTGKSPYQPDGEPIYDGNQATWIHEIIDISDYSNYPISLRLILKSDDIVNWDGWYVDNIKVSVFDTTTDVEDFEQLPKVFSLLQNFPNPFNPSTVISYQLPVGGNVTLKIFDILGNEVATLVNEYKPAGKYEVEFNSHSGEVRNLTSGVYFYQLKAEEYINTKKMLLLK